MTSVKFVHAAAFYSSITVNSTENPIKLLLHCCNSAQSKNRKWWYILSVKIHSLLSVFMSECVCVLHLYASFHITFPGHYFISNPFLLESSNFASNFCLFYSCTQLVWIIKMFHNYFCLLTPQHLSYLCEIYALIVSIRFMFA